MSVHDFGMRVRREMDEPGLSEMGTKRCPQCGELLFADMDVCYGCMHDFTRDALDGQVASRHLTYGMGGLTRRSCDEPALDMEMAGTAPRRANMASQDAQAPSQASRPLLGSPPTSHAAWDDHPIRPALPDELSENAPVPQHGFDGTRLVLKIRSQSMDVAVPVAQGGITVGRLEENDVVLHARSVSRHHVRLVPEGKGVVVEDLGATNPARFHGKDAPPDLRMAPGDSLEICGTTFSLALIP